MLGSIRDLGESSLEALTWAVGVGEAARRRLFWEAYSNVRGCPWRLQNLNQGSISARALSGWEARNALPGRALRGVLWRWGPPDSVVLDD